MAIGQFPSSTTDTFMLKWVSTGVVTADGFDTINGTKLAYKNMAVNWSPGIYYYPQQLFSSSGTNTFPFSYQNYSTREISTTALYLEDYNYFTHSAGIYFNLTTPLTNLRVYLLADYIRVSSPQAPSEIRELDGKFVITGYGSNTYFTSTDMVTFTTRTPNSTLTYPFLTVGVGETNKYVWAEKYEYAGITAYHTSTDEVTWTARNFASNGTIRDMIYANGDYWAIQYRTGVPDHAILQSTDAVTWTARYSTTVGQLYRIAYGAGETNPYVAIGNNTTDTRLKVSTNGVTWTNATLPAGATTYSGTSLIYEGGSFYAYGNANMQSTDGVTWSTSGFTLSTTRYFFHKIGTNKYLYANGYSQGNIIYYTTSLTDSTNDIRVVSTLDNRNPLGYAIYFMGIYSTTTTYDYYFSGSQNPYTYFAATDVLEGYFSTVSIATQGWVFQKIERIGRLKVSP